MERIYSAFFGSERRGGDVPLTAAALEKHNADTRALELGPARPMRTLRPPSPPPVAVATNGFVVVDGQVLAVDGIVRSPTNDDGDKLDGDAMTGQELARLWGRRPRLPTEVKAALRAALRAFVLAYGAKAFTAVLLASRKWSRSEYSSVADAVRLLLRKDTIRFGAFFGSLVGVFRLTELAARAVRGRRDPTNLAIAGAVSGLTLLVDSPGRRSSIALYLFVRMLDVLGRHLTATGALPTWKYSSEGLFAASNAVIMYAFIADPSLLPKGYYQWILQMGAVTHHGIGYAVRPGLHGNIDGFRRCQPHYHMESCLTHAMKEWVGGLARSVQIYMPVHFLPAVIFKFHHLKNAPLSTTARISYSALCSSAFLTSYQTIVKLVICTIRNALQRDYIFQTWLAGLMTGATLFLEDPKRRFELMLYCVPRALDIIWQVLVRKRIVRYVKHSEVLLFCLSMAVIMSRPAEHFKPTYLRILRFLFGRAII